MRSHLLAAAVVASLGLVSADAFAAPASSGVSQAQLQQLQAQIAALQAQVQQLQNDSQALQAQSDAQSEVNITQAQALETAQKTQTSVDKLAKLVNDNKIGGRMFFDLTNIDKTSNGKDTAASGTGLDVKRFYLTVDHKFNDIWSANLTTDFQYSSAIGNTELFVKKAYVQGSFDPAFNLRVGAADMPWIPYVEKFYGMRYVENTLTDRLKYGNSSDWGLHGFGNLGNNFNYAVSVVSGAGYKNPTRSKGMDVEGRVAYTPNENFVVAVGGYSGKLGKETDIQSAENTYTRANAMVAYADSDFRVGGEYFQAKNLNNVTTVATDKSSGWSVWGSVRVTDGGINVFGRYDDTDVSKTLDPTLSDKYWNVGVEFPVMKNLKLSTVYKYTHLANASDKKNDKTKEFGVWGDLSF
ncbi:porin [Stenotrophomonas maltophilia]|uniref:porin n=1 Tax=Stenotrophomonas TaxID=40323 RepID=UPI00201CFF1F|nr:MULTISPECIES: porin [Stenotrophomonas]MBN5025114.1 carbohydrate porin [Stenotrophomonas maltophilia]MDH1274263.1 OprO/OprP family phosphate-selective porin [Stenotrophomonas sp. GD03937]MDH1486499.1 OprO/OprP family phosphate-selective porin [Stenotrophomonas sp. GD03712]UQY97484.1 OprO/OprP family phosphate-selective porin [Stenotrophomonas maltophilia]WON70045.1 porin [Stenotrophomonas maltophilia]